MAALAPLPETVEGEIWAARLGDTAIVGTPGELFSEIGAEVRRRSPFDTTIFAGYCQGVLGYVSTPEEYQFGGYEPTVAQRGYGHPAPFSPAASRILIEESILLLESMRAQSV
jgi:neutral ceramidase